MPPSPVESLFWSDGAFGENAGPFGLPPLENLNWSDPLDSSGQIAPIENFSDPMLEANAMAEPAYFLPPDLLLSEAPNSPSTSIKTSDTTTNSTAPNHPTSWNTKFFRPPQPSLPIQAPNNTLYLDDVTSSACEQGKNEWRLS